ncbi:MAG: 16S rRNA (adenine(1518)-N(6)/adenine(1519)-N(6))-dimethyltransferase RsmA [Gemmatimonadales bacterium]
MARAPRPNKSLGQHFLTDRHILARIVDAAEPEAQDVVIEIGAGTGTLTRQLAARVALVLAVEKDHALARRLRDACASEPELRNVRVIEADFLRPGIHWKDVDPAVALARPPKFVGNIPYAITTPIIEAVLLQQPPLAVVLMQEEVADRLSAPPGSRTYGGLSVGVQVLARAEKLFTVKAGSFHPPPRVTSTVVRLRPRPHPLLERHEIARFRDFVTASFSRRRKQLRNVLRAVTGEPAAQVERRLASLGLSPTARPETLTPEDFVRLFREQALDARLA